MPWGLVVEVDADFSFADAVGIGKKAWAGKGLAGSRGGAFRMVFGIDAIGCECSTSFSSSLAQIFQNMKRFLTYPACIRVKESPPNPIVPDFVHPPTPIKEDCQHSFS